MTSSSVIVAYPMPTKYNLVGGNQSPFILQGSQVGVNYQLQLKEEIVSEVQIQVQAIQYNGLRKQLKEPTRSRQQILQQVAQII